MSSQGSKTPSRQQTPQASVGSRIKGWFSGLQCPLKSCPLKKCKCCGYVQQHKLGVIIGLVAFVAYIALCAFLDQNSTTTETTTTETTTTETPTPTSAPADDSTNDKNDDASNGEGLNENQNGNLQTDSTNEATSTVTPAPTTTATTTLEQDSTHDVDKPDTPDSGL